MNPTNDFQRKIENKKKELDKIIKRIKRDRERSIILSRQIKELEQAEIFTKIEELGLPKDMVCSLLDDLAKQQAASAPLDHEQIGADE